MQFKSLAFLLILSLLFLSGCGSKEEKKEEPNKPEKVVIKKRTNFILNTIENKQIEIELKDNKIILKNNPNKIVLLNFFATWCPSCIAEIPSLQKLQSSFSNDFEIISILLEKDKTNEEIINFSKNSNINFTIVNSPENFELATSLGEIKSIPTMYLIDKDSNIFQKYVGMVPFEMLEIDIKKILAK